mgnify:CR=1 FL=1
MTLGVNYDADGEFLSFRYDNVDEFNADGLGAATENGAMYLHDELMLYMYGLMTADEVRTNAKGAERRFRATRANGDEMTYVGERGAERMVSAVRIDGTREFYAGPPGDAYLTRTIYPDGRIVFRRGRTPQRVPVAGVWHADGPRGHRDGVHARLEEVGRRPRAQERVREF